MRASVYHDYGSANILGFKDIGKPAVREDEVLV